VPPRTTSKPYISVTVQSSTESAQDNYLDQQDRRSEVNSQSSHAHSNSSDSLDSTRANSLARGIRRPPHIIATPIAIPREPIAPSTANASTETSDSAVQNESLKSGSNKGNLVAEEPFVAPIPRRKLSSIGIQVGQGLWLPLLRDSKLVKFTQHCYYTGKHASTFSVMPKSHCCIISSPNVSCKLKVSLLWTLRYH